VDAVAAAHRRPDLYLVTDVTTPFEQDGTRDGERIRDWMHRTFVAELVAHDRPFVEVSGTRAERLATAAAAVRRLTGQSGSAR
jgi:nicotinamide riboside kinase